MGAAYAGLVAGKLVKGSTAGADTPSTAPPTRNGASKEVKGGRDVKSRKSPPETKCPREEDTTVSPIAAGHLLGRSRRGGNR